MRRVGRFVHEVIQLPGVPEGPARARRFVRESLAGYPEHVIETAQLLVSELVTNAVIHGEPPVRIELDIEPPGVSVSVRDRGEDAPVLREPTQAGEHGRGLHIVRCLADEWGVEREMEGTCVWFRL
jgi:anti-sigma regulatory factor (Ser/Thr protein kinase)